MPRTPQTFGRWELPSSKWPRGLCHSRPTASSSSAWRSSPASFQPPNISLMYSFEYLATTGLKIMGDTKAIGT